jgi:hypothetical protein
MFTVAQITFDALDGATGEVKSGRIAPADRAGLRRFLERWSGRRVESAVEATTGWRFVVEELQRIHAVLFHHGVRAATPLGAHPEPPTSAITAASSRRMPALERPARSALKD